MVKAPGFKSCWYYYYFLGSNPSSCFICGVFFDKYHIDFRVYTTWGISLARVTMVDWQDELVLDLLVKPTDQILDCNTKFSGLTDEMLANAECDLSKVSLFYF